MLSTEFYRISIVNSTLSELKDKNNKIIIKMSGIWITYGG